MVIKSDWNADDIFAFITALSGRQDRAKELPAWALLLRSPYRAAEGAPSWLGGCPCMPADLKWPRDGDGAPLHFLAQIDLSSLEAEPETGSRPPGLEEQGALPIFVGNSYSCLLLNGEQMARAALRAAPDDLEPISKYGFFGEDRTFGYWPVDIVPFLDTDGERPSILPDRFARPADWITTWGVAALEAEIAIECLERELRWGEDFQKHVERGNAAGKEMPASKVITSKIEHYGLMSRRAPGLVDRLKAWRVVASSKMPTDPVDMAVLDPVFMERVALSKEMQNYMPKFILPGEPREVWNRIMAAYPSIRKDGDFDAVPAAYRPFVEAVITDWRGHRLFGLEVPPPHNTDTDLRGRDCLINVRADQLLRTQSEHEYGMSIWYPRKRMAKGSYEEGVFLRHGKG